MVVNVGGEKNYRLLQYTERMQAANQMWME